MASKLKACPSPLCPCVGCVSFRQTAKLLVDRGSDLRDLHDYIRPFVLAERDSRMTTRPYSVRIGGGNPNGETAIALGEDQYEGGGAGPWHENAIRALEDGGEA